MEFKIDNNSEIRKVGFYASIILSAATIITFGFAMIAIPPSGPYCPANCMEYPFLKSLTYYPRDYLWMYCAMLQLVAYFIVMISIHFITLPGKKIYTFIGFSFSIISATVLLSDYFIQFAVVPISYMKNEFDGIPLISQYNGHGIFIALEELGYILMSFSLLSIAPSFSVKNRLERAIKLVLIVSFVGTMLSFVFYTLKYGIDRSYRFEVAAITVNFLTLITIGILMAIYFHKKKNDI
jgi:hypothetical protein